jgi:hypothetical protein
MKRFLLALLIALSFHAHAEITVGGDVRAHHFSEDEPTVGLTDVPAGATITVWIADRSGGMTVSGCSDADGSYGAAVEDIVHSTTWHDYMFRRHNSSGGNITVTCTLGAAQNTQLTAMWAASDQGVLEDDGPFDSNEESPADTSFVSPTLTATAAPGVMVAGLSLNSPQTEDPTMSTGECLTFSESGGRIYACALVYESTGNQSISGTLASSSVKRLMVGLYKESAGGGETSALPVILQQLEH